MEEPEPQVPVPGKSLETIPPSVLPSTMPAGVGQMVLPKSDAFIDAIKQQQRIRDYILKQLKPNIHYGNIPGVPKPFLWQAGATLIANGLQADPEFLVYVLDKSDENYMVEAKCRLISRVNGGASPYGLARAASMAEEKFSARARKKGILLELRNVVEQWAQTMDQLRQHLSAEARYAHPYSSVKYIVYDMLKCADKEAMLGVVGTMYEKAERPDALKLSVRFMSQKRAFVGICRTFVGFDDHFTQDDDLVADKKDDQDEGGQASSSAAKPAKPVKPSRTATPEVSGAGEPQGSAKTRKDAPADAQATSEQYVELTKLCSAKDTDVATVAQKRGWEMPLTGIQAAALIVELKVGG